jgi:hypothetical protein
MKKELSETIVSFLGLMLVFLAPIHFTLYNIMVMAMALSLAFFGRIIVQKRCSGEKIAYKTDKRTLFLSMILSFFSLGIIRWAAPGGFKKQPRRTALYGVAFNIVIGVIFLMVAMVFGTSALLSETAFVLTVFFVRISETNLVFAVSSMIPVGILDGKTLYKDKKTFWAILTLSVMLLFMFFMWYRFSVLYKVFELVL